MSKIRLGEPIFRSIQGEGDRTGRLSIWVRFAGCTLRCGGFFQDDPTDKTTWIKPISLAPKEYKSLNDLPILPVGCDSLYSIDPKFKHLWTMYDNASALVEDIKPFLYNDGKSWSHPITDNNIDLCFTGGEPMLFQQAMVDIMQEVRCDDQDVLVQIETNATKLATGSFLEYAQSGIEHGIHFNISPKLYHVSGEKDAVNYDIIQQYQELTESGILKFVINNDDRAWDELNSHVKNLRAYGVWLPIFVMPCGATKEQQEDSRVIAAIANRAVDNGYHMSGRIHATIWGNTIGV